jgi:hypothetical protein
LSQNDLPSEPGWPDWANFRILGNCSFSTVFYRISPNFWTTIFHGKSGRNGLGEFFANSSGHPDLNMPMVWQRFVLFHFFLCQRSKHSFTHYLSFRISTQQSVLTWLSIHRCDIVNFTKVFRHWFILKIIMLFFW